MTDSRKSFLVFVSGPYDDLEDERRAVIVALQKLQLPQICMEFFGARSKNPLETSLSEVKRSDIMIIIVGHKYGSLVPDNNISYSEAEYKEAHKLGKPCLVYFKDESMPIPPEFIEDDPHKIQALCAFKKLLKKEHTIAYFKDQLDLAVSVTIDLMRQIEVLSKRKIKVPARALTLKIIPQIWNLKMYTGQLTQSHFHMWGHEPWVKDVENVTNGRVKVIIHPQQTLMRSIDAWEDIKSGIVDIAWIFSGYFPDQFDLSSSVTLPFLIPNGRVGSRVMWSLYQQFPEIREQMAEVKILSLCTSEPYFLLTNRKQVKITEDLRDMKIRTTGTLAADMIKLLNSTPIFVPMAETYLALKVGVIDGILEPALPILDFRLYEVAKYCTYVPTVCDYFMLVMNKGIWDEMPSDVQKAIMSISGEAQAIRYGSAFDRDRRELPQIAKATSHEIIEYTIPNEELAKWINIAGKPIWSSWVNKMTNKGYENASNILDETMNLTKRFADYR